MKLDPNHALVVLSGGQDSTTCAALARAEYPKVSAITFNYGQRHARELQAACMVAQILGLADHEVVPVGDLLRSTSPLTDPGAELEQYSDYESMDKIIGDRVEKTFVPMRNAFFLTLAANRAVAMGAGVLITGVCEADNANYPDCRVAFIQAQERTINEALGLPLDPPGLKISTPLITLSKEASIRMLLDAGIEDYALLGFTHTAYDGQYPPTGKDHASVLRAEGFARAGVPDPLVLRAAKLDGVMELPNTPNYWSPDSRALAAEALHAMRTMQKLLGWGAA